MWYFKIDHGQFLMHPSFIIILQSNLKDTRCKKYLRWMKLYLRNAVKRHCRHHFSDNAARHESSQNPRDSSAYTRSYLRMISYYSQKPTVCWVTPHPNQRLPSGSALLPRNHRQAHLAPWSMPHGAAANTHDITAHTWNFNTQQNIITMKQYWN